MPIIEGDLWKHPGHPGMIVVTTGTTIDSQGQLVMEAGPAREAAERIPGIQRQCAQAILELSSQDFFGFIPVRPSRPQDNLLGFGIFQSRREAGQPADPDLIETSLSDLRRFAASNPNVKLRMNYPGIGDEGLPVEAVAPLITSVPRNLTICHNGEVAPSVSHGLEGTKELFLTIERWILEGRSGYAVEYLMENGYDREAASEQVAAVRSLIQDRAERAASRYRQNQTQSWEQSRLNL
jgi:hypothetical protein